MDLTPVTTCPQAMSLEDRIRQAVGRALDDVRTRMEQEVRTLVQDLVAGAAEDRQLAIAQSRDQILADAKQQADQRVAEAEAHLTATIDRVVADACAREREQATVQARRAADAEAEDRAQRLLEAVRSLDAAGSTNDLLDALGTLVAREAGRIGIFVVRGTSFQGWALSGFGAIDSQPTRLEVPIAQAPLVQRAVQSKQTVASSDAQSATSADQTTTGLSSGGIAVPLVVRDRVTAVVYADALTADGREASLAKGWSSIVELVARHAARCLETLEAQRAPTLPRAATATLQSRGAAGERGRRAVPGSARAEHARAEAPVSPEGLENSARRLARLLIAEIKLHNEASVHEGRQAGNLLTRLAPQIERARRVYDARVPASVMTRAQLFHQELVTTLADGDASRLGASA